MTPPLDTPSAGPGAALRLPGSQGMPRIDERLVQPETREEIVRGRRLLAMPASAVHADQHHTLNYVLNAYVKEDCVGSAKLLTRASESSDFATDTCIRRRGTDPTTGTRYLEELAFYFVNEQSLHDITERAEDLTACGVRRVIAIFVEKGEVCEWSPKGGTWQTLELDATFNDATLAYPLRVRDLVDPAEADNAVVRALVAKGNPVMLEALEEGDPMVLKALEASRPEGHPEGRAKGLRAAVRDICELLDIRLTPEREAAIARMDIAQLDALRERLKRDRRWD